MEVDGSSHSMEVFQLGVWRVIGSSGVKNRSIVDNLSIMGIDGKNAADWALALSVFKLPLDTGLMVHFVEVRTITVHDLNQAIERRPFFTV